MNNVEMNVIDIEEESEEEPVEQQEE